eukprot:9213821-Pyramimonas_sp.AAC.1
MRLLLLAPCASCRAKRNRPPSVQSHQPSGRRWSREFPLPTPFVPSGRGLPLHPAPSRGPGRGFRE